MMRAGQRAVSGCRCELNLCYMYRADERGDETMRLVMHKLRAIL